MLVDTHCHLDFPVFDKDRLLILEKCRQQNITSIVVPGVCRKDWQRLLWLCHEQAILYPALGLHPCFLEEHQPDDLHKLAQLCDTEHLHAIGEIGLDYYNRGSKNRHVHEPDRDRQRYYFSEQLQIAKQHQLPVLIHARKSHDEVIQQLKAVPSLKGIIHAYSGSYEQAREYLKLGFKLGFGGAYTYSKATKLRTMVPKLPLDAWVLETDAPDMTPVCHHGEHNSPQYLPEIAQEFQLLYAARFDSEKISTQLYQNAQDVFPAM